MTRRWTLSKVSLKKRFVALIRWRTNYACHFYYYSLLNNNRPAYRLRWWGHSKNHSQEQIGKICEEVWENHVETAGWPVTPASEQADGEGRHPCPLYLLLGGADTSRSEPTKQKTNLVPWQWVSFTRDSSTGSLRTHTEKRGCAVFTQRFTLCVFVWE